MTAAEGVARMMGLSPMSEKRLFLILACVACQDNEGWFETSRRRLASFAGVTVDSARRFLDWLDSSGWVEVDDAHAGRAKRRFVWVGQKPGKMTHFSNGGWVNSPGIRPGGGSISRKNDPQSGSNRRENDPHYIIYNNVTVGAGASADATAPPPSTIQEETGLPDPVLYPEEYAKAMVAMMEAELAEKERNTPVADEDPVAGDA